nr:virulence-associated E family protein [Leptolyngbya sp. FACHB-17]
MTEGFKDAAAGTIHGGIPTGAIPGVSHCYKALKPKAGYTLLYDADGWRNPNVFTQLFKAGLYLNGKIQLVPEIQGEPKAGLCEYFKAGYTAQNYRSLIDSAFEPEEFLLEIPKHWAALEQKEKQKCVDAILRLAIIYLSRPKADQLIQAIRAIRAEIDKDSISELAESVIEKYRKDNRIEELARLPGGYLWSAISKDRTFFDYLSLIQGFGSKLRFNTLKKQVELESKPFSAGIAKTQLNIQYGFRAKSNNATFSEVFLLAAKRNSYSPIVEYLDRVSTEHGNSTEILSSFAERYFGQTEPIYNSMIKRSLIAAVARAYNPGCKVDTALILQGKQGAGKSTFFKILAGDQYFDDSLANVSDKDEKLKLHRVWFVEWAELETVFRRKDVAATKAFLSSSTDFVRPPYGRDTEEMPRSSVIVGTTNQNEFLSDSTGNRRFWVIPVLKDINAALLKAERDRIWAAAVALYKASEQWWLFDLEEIAAAGIAEQFQTSDPWTDPVLSYVDALEFVTTKEILDLQGLIETARQDKASQMRIAEILKKAGWRRDSKRIEGKVTKGWIKPELPTAQPQVDQSEPRNPKNPELPAWVTPNAIAVHKPTGTKFSITKAPKNRPTGEYKLQSETGEKYWLRDCEPYRERLVS